MLNQELILNCELALPLAWARLLQIMVQTKTSFLQTLGKLFDPRKSPLIFFLAFFLVVPAIVYGIVGTGVLEAGRAATIGTWIEITAPTEGQTFFRGTSVTVSASGYSETPANLILDVNGVALTNCGGSDITGAASVTGSFNRTCYWDASFIGTMTAKATLVPADTPAISALASDQVTYNVIEQSLSYTWANPYNGQTVSGPVSLRWVAGGLKDKYELGATRYNVYLDRTTLIATGNLGTPGVCSPTDWGLWQCTHSPAWNTQGLSNGSHTLTGMIDMTTIDGGKHAESTITINVNNQDQPPVCDLITLSDNDIYSGDSVTIMGTGHDPDGTVLTLGQISYGNGRSSAELVPSRGVVTTTYSGYTVASGSAQYTVTARFQSHGLWGEYPIDDTTCTEIITVRARESGNTCPVITSTPLTSIKVGSTYSYTLHYTDNDTVVLKAVAKPGWLSWNAASGTLSGTPSAQHIGTHSVVLAVDDGDPSCHTQQAFTIRVWDDTDGDDSDDGDDGDVGGAGAQVPSIVVTNPGQGSQFFCGGSTIAWRITDDGTIEKIWIEYSTDAENWTKIDGDLAGTTTSYDWDVCSLPLGTYYVRVWARDNDGNERAGMSNPFEIVATGELSSSPRIINPIPEPDSTVTETKPSISADFVPADSAIDVDSVIVKIDDKAVTAYVTVTTDGFDYVPTDDLAIGEHTVYVKVVDEESKAAEKVWTFTVAESVVCTFSLLGLTLPCWVLYALIVCGALLLLLIIIVAIVRLVALARENNEEEQTGGEGASETDSWTPPEGGADSSKEDTGYPEPGATVPPASEWQGSAQGTNLPSGQQVEDKPTVTI